MLLDARGRTLRRSIGFLPELVPERPAKEELPEVTLELVATEKVEVEEYWPLETCQPDGGRPVLDRNERFDFRDAQDKQEQAEGPGKRATIRGVLPGVDAPARRKRPGPGRPA